MLKCLGYLDGGFAAGIALPGDDDNKGLVDEIRRSLGKLGLVVFLVSRNNGVSTIGNLPP